MKRILLTISVLAAAVLAAGTSAQAAGAIPAKGGTAERPVKVSCVGNSVTFGMLIEDREHNSYPAQLQRMLGPGYEVGNFGRSGATLLRHGHMPYFDQAEFRRAMDFAGDIVVIHLGLNDTDPRDWPNYRDEFVGDYLALIDSLRSVNPQARVMIALMSPIGDRHRRFISGTQLWHSEIQETIRTVAGLAGVELIDFHTPLYAYPWLLPDALHPNVEGAGLLAKTVYQEITGDYGGLRLPMLYGDGMVIQRREPVRIAGTADAGTAVTVRLGDREGRAVTGKDGRWAVTLPAMEAARDLTLTVATDRGEQKAFKDVAVGEVWLCSGQSNMEFSLGQALGAAEDIAAASDADLRLFDMEALYATDNVAWPAEYLDSLNHLQYYAPAKWTASAPESARRFSAIGYYFGKMLRDSLDVPVGLIHNAIGGSTTESWIDRNTLESQFPAILKDWLNNDFIQDWARGRAAKNISARTELPETSRYGALANAREVTRHPYEPCYLFEAGMLPLEAYNIKGVIWYQGESNAHNFEAHEQLFPMLVDSWRNYFGKPDLPFHYVQLSSLNRPSWTWFRDSQRRLLASRPHLGMVVTSDVGDETDVHPRRKKPVGERLGIQVLTDVYHATAPGTPSHGPYVQSVTPGLDGRIWVSFGAERGLRPSDGERIIGFEVLDAADGRFHEVGAKVARLGAYDCIELDASALQRPAAVRYGWQPYTLANLVGGTGLPASTFRVDL